MRNKLRIRVMVRVKVRTRVAVRVVLGVRIFFYMRDGAFCAFFVSTFFHGLAATRLKISEISFKAPQIQPPKLPPPSTFS